MMKELILLLIATTLSASCSALETPEKQAAETTEPQFKSRLFSKGTLVYSDDFDGEFNRERWGSPKKGRLIKDGKLIVTPQFTSREEAMKVLKRDHHLGLEPVVHLNRIPEKFVCHLRYKFEKPKLTPGRPSFQIGHHMISLGILEARMDLVSDACQHLDTVKEADPYGELRDQAAEFLQMLDCDSVTKL